MLRPMFVDTLHHFSIEATHLRSTPDVTENICSAYVGEGRLYILSDYMGVLQRFNSRLRDLEEIHTMIATRTKIPSMRRARLLIQQRKVCQYSKVRRSHTEPRVARETWISGCICRPGALALLPHCTLDPPLLFPQTQRQCPYQ